MSERVAEDSGPIQSTVPSGFPEALRIGPILFTVAYQQDELEGSMGTTNGRQESITISLRQSRRNMIDTLLHETLHAMVFVCGLCLRGATDDEQIVRPVASALYDTLSRNPTLCHLLAESP